MAKSTAKGTPRRPKSWKSKKVKMALETAPTMTQGLNLPHLDLVLSMITPIMGSLMASQILVAAMMEETAQISQSASPMASVKKTMMYMLTRV